MRSLSLEVIRGKAWKFGDDVDTDVIIQGKYLVINEPEELAKHVFENIKPEFAKAVKKGDFVVAGENFGCGSSRQQAVDCFKALGIGAIIAESFGAIYERNAINSALPILVAEKIATKINDGDTLIVDFITGEIIDKTQGKTYRAKPFSKVQLEIYRRGGLLNLPDKKVG